MNLILVILMRSPSLILGFLPFQRYGPIVVGLMDYFGYEKRLFGYLWIGNEFHGTHRVE
jgi:hypothetical protein